MKRRSCLVVLLIVLLAAGIACFGVYLFLRYGFDHDLIEIRLQAEGQLLQYPIDKGAITAGYGNQNYLEKNGYPHYGLDITAANGGQADVLASGSGSVLGTEFCENSVGNIAVIRYDDVYIPQTGEVCPLIARYYHMTSVAVRTGDAVSAGQRIGEIDRRHKWYHHIHIELDTDLGYPFHTPQVAEASSELLHRHPASGDSIVNPIGVLAVDRGQRLFVHPGADSCTADDAPRYAIQR